MERIVAVEHVLGRHRGVVVRIPLSEAQSLVDSGQSRFVEVATLPKVETPEEAAPPPVVRKRRTRRKSTG